jgi:hypothetical protein
VNDALEELEVEFKEIERRRIDAEREARERQTAFEAAETLRKAAAAMLAAATAKLDAKDFEGARALTRDVLAKQPQHPAAIELDRRIREALRAVEEENKKIKEAEAPTERAGVNRTPEELPKSAPVQKTIVAQPRSLKPLALAIAAVLVIAILGLSIFKIFNPSGVAPEAGQVVVDVLPWATIESVTRNPAGTKVETDCVQTPCVLSLPAGEYHVRAVNPNFSGKLEFDVTVEAVAIREQRQSFPGFSPEDEVMNILQQSK